MSMSRHSRAMLLNVLWHHQGGSSRVGQPIRSIIGLERNERMTDEQVDEAKWIDRLLAAGTDAPDVAMEPVARVDAADDGYFADILPDRDVKVGQMLYAIPPDAAAEVAKLRAEVTRLRMFPPGGRAPHKITMAPHVGPTNAEFYGIKLETDEDFSAWGRAVPNESEA